MKTQKLFRLCLVWIVTALHYQIKLWKLHQPVLGTRGASESRRRRSHFIYTIYNLGFYSGYYRSLLLPEHSNPCGHDPV